MSATIKTFDDLVFEHRNKSYGAYVLRKGYGRSIVIATVIGIAVLLLLASIPAISAWITKLTEKPIEVKKETKVELAEVKQPEDLPPPPPPPPAEIEPPKVEMAKFTEPEVEEVVKDEDLPPPPDEAAKTNIGNENQEGEEFADLPDPDAGKVVVEEVVEQKPFTVVEQMPQFPGGDDALIKYLAKNIKYPEIAKDAGTQGTVYLTFVVDSDGNISKEQVLRSLSGAGAKDCANEALRVVKSMPKWSPGKQNGKAVPVQYNLPVKFTLK